MNWVKVWKPTSRHHLVAAAHLAVAVGAIASQAAAQQPGSYGTFDLGDQPPVTSPSMMPSNQITFGQPHQLEPPPPARPRRIGWPLLRPASPDDPHRFWGRGELLVGTSWLNRPWHAGWLVGSMLGDELIAGSVEREADLFGGFRLGRDVNHYWGYEGRFAFANVGISDDQGGLGTSREWLADVHLVHFPWGDTRLRPFGSIGLGIATFRFHDQAGQWHDETLLHFPIGGGLKYYFRRWLAVRGSVVNNIALAGGDLATMHNVSATVGVEVHWGSRRTSYESWSPGRLTVTP